MIRMRHLISIITLLALSAGCSYHAAVNRLSPDEQAQFRAHSKVMSSGQARTYLSKATADERKTYLEQIGTAQRFAALDAADQESVLNGFIRKDMSAEAVRFLWGEPGWTDGRTGHYEYWYYSGSSLDLVENGNRLGDAGTVVEVFLVNDRVAWWLETVPESNDDPGEVEKPRS